MTMPKETKKTVRPEETTISDIELSAFLLCKDYPLLRTEGTPHRIEFVFGRVPQEVVFSFYQDSSLVNGRKLLSAYRAIKGLVIEAKRRER